VHVTVEGERDAVRVRWRWPLGRHGSVPRVKVRLAGCEEVLAVDEEVRVLRKTT
jgi:hypothetical protein